MTPAALTTPIIVDLRGYWRDVVERLKVALEKGAPARPDPRHPRLLVVEAGGESFYIYPLPSGKIVLLGHWTN